MVDLEGGDPESSAEEPGGADPESSAEGPGGADPDSSDNDYNT